MNMQCLISMNKCPVCLEGIIVKEEHTAQFMYIGALVDVDRLREYCNVCGTILQSTETVKHNVEQIRLAKEYYQNCLTK